MSFIAEYTLDSPILAAARAESPGVEYEVVDEFVTADEPPVLTAWASGPDAALERFDAAVRSDPTLASATVLASVPDRRLYRIELSPEGACGMTYPVAMEHGITFLEVRATGEAVHYRAMIPNRDALSAYRSACAERDLDFTLDRLYRSEGAPSAASALTDRQRTVLRAAFEAGYFDVPRSTSLDALADRFDVSEQSLSATLRRAQSNLFAETFDPDR
ncbi:helix-turn-helix domain-containing protein [Halovivax limisalsi]|uniref:helix-turn-helix domain-containing protein n=1 Tax=Halovivax limisalsi TaxID=1453760 RepID=UPI001FFD76C9|nr:helix-turn-helix domain-containing protein [Halovivax limisalsi]